MRALALLAAIVAAFPAVSAPPSPLQADQKDPTKAPKIYVVPFGVGGHGQIGTDIHSSIYEKLVQDVKAKKPDLLVLKLESFDRTKNWQRDMVGRDEMGRFDREDARKTLLLFKQDLAEFPQVMWVKDSVGFATLFAMAWPNMYTDGEARLYGLARINEMTQHPDPEVQRKFEAAIMSIANGFLKEGGHPSVLGDAMMRPEKLLSVSFKGRELTWLPDTTGTIVIDGSPESVANIDARTAEDLGLSGGTAESIEDLMFQMGYREWDDSLVKQGLDGQKLVGDYVTNWRKAMDASLQAWGQYEQLKGDSDPKGLPKQAKALEQIRDAMAKYPAVEFRWKQQSGGKMNRDAVDGMIKQVRDQIKKSKAKGSSS